MTLMHVAIDAALFCAGFGAAEALRRFRSRPRAPKPPSCTALLRSGEECKCALGHAGPHRTWVDVDGTGRFYQGYAWEDPAAGLHTAGFFLKQEHRK